MCESDKPSGSASASAIVVDASRGCHHLRIEGFSLTKGHPSAVDEGIKSCPFTVGRRRWHMLYYPNGDCPDSAGYVSVFLVLDDDKVDSNEVRAQFQFTVGASGPAPAPFKSATETHDFGSGSWGFGKFIKREDLERSGHLKEDSFTIRCDIAVIHGMRATAAAATASDSPPAPPAFVAVPPSDLNRHLGDLLRSGKGADVVFDVGGETFAAHRCVLAARSPVASAELFGATTDNNAAGAGADGGVVRIDDMDGKVFRALLCFVYTDSLPEMKEEDGEGRVMCQHLLVTADRYGMERLKLICEEKLCGCIDVGTVAKILTLAEQHGCQGLKKACFSFLRCAENLKAVMASDGFAHLSRSCPSSLIELISMNPVA